MARTHLCSNSGFSRAAPPSFTTNFIGDPPPHAIQPSDSYSAPPERQHPSIDCQDMRSRRAFCRQKQAETQDRRNSCVQHAEFEGVVVNVAPSREERQNKTGPI